MSNAVVIAVVLVVKICHPEDSLLNPMPPKENWMVNAAQNLAYMKKGNSPPRKTPSPKQPKQESTTTTAPPVHRDILSVPSLVNSEVAASPNSKDQPPTPKAKEAKVEPEKEEKEAKEEKEETKVEEAKEEEEEEEVKEVTKEKDVIKREEPEAEKETSVEQTSEKEKPDLTSPRTEKKAGSAVNTLLLAAYAMTGPASDSASQSDAEGDTKEEEKVANDDKKEVEKVAPKEKDDDKDEKLEEVSSVKMDIPKETKVKEQPKDVKKEKDESKDEEEEKGEKERIETKNTSKRKADDIEEENVGRVSPDSVGVAPQDKKTRLDTTTITTKEDADVGEETKKTTETKNVEV